MWHTLSKSEVKARGLEYNRQRYNWERSKPEKWTGFDLASSPGTCLSTYAILCYSLCGTGSASGGCRRWHVSQAEFNWYACQGALNWWEFMISSVGRTSQLNISIDTQSGSAEATLLSAIRNSGYDQFCAGNTFNYYLPRFRSFPTLQERVTPVLLFSCFNTSQIYILVVLEATLRWFFVAHAEKGISNHIRCIVRERPEVVWLTGGVARKLNCGY